eukprot:CAMPEP_0180519802 /NCGR_PEP_ID=MMETSP1036_2-20121128/55901_1 /TAXON_ID=632150 /ORGANISM="Azadinium spinosum, Strain 3D9" /LENGTH=40 /DNA_ID= /DNA_START= /DNA_END= /DNA_ORIENTATION=
MALYSVLAAMMGIISPMEIDAQKVIDAAAAVAEVPGGQVS